MIDRRRTARELVPLLLIAALAVGFLWRMTLGGKVMLPGDLLLLMEPWRHYSRQFPEFEQVSNPILDAVQQFYPWRKYAGESLREGVVPLWNPHELCGNPFVGNNQSAVFYPETWLHALMPTEWALGWSTALYFLLTGSLTYWFLRIVQLRRSAALLGAVAFMFNGFIIGWLCFPSFRSVPGWLPGMLVGCEMCVRRKHMGWAAISALCIGMQFLAGNLHISMIVLIVFAAYVAVRSAGAWLSGERKAALVAVGGALVATVVGGLLAAAQLLPALELAGMSSRAGGITYAGVLKHAIAPSYLLAALMPDLFGNPVDYNHWGGELGQTYRAYTETAWYVGVAPLLLAPAAFWRRPRSQTWFWAAMLLVGIALAMGTPLYALVYYLVPGAKSLSGLGRSILISSTALAVLGALGLDVLLHRAEEDAAAVRKYAWRAGLALGVVGLVGGMWVWMTTGSLEEALPGIGSYTGLQIARFVALCAAVALVTALLPWRRRIATGSLVGLLALDLYCFVAKFTPATRPEYLHIQARSIERIQQDRDWPRVLALGEDVMHRMAPNTPMIVGLEDIQGSDSLEVGTYRRLLNALSSDRLGFPQPDPALPAIDLLGVRYILSGVELDPLPGVSLLSSYDSWLYLNEHALPRAFTVPEYETRSTPAAVLDAVTSADFEPSRQAIFARSDAPSAGPSLPLPVVEATVTAHEANRVVVEGDFSPGQLLVLADTYYPGWRAYQDGRECRIMRADYALRAIRIEQPCREVRFVYRPASFAAGMFASLLALAFLAAVGMFSLATWRGRRNA